MKPIVFNKNTSWKFDTKDADLNRYFLKETFRRLTDAFDVYGYMYLNKVYERLFVKWNPDDENICFRKENGPITFEFYYSEDKNEYIINIAQ